MKNMLEIGRLLRAGTAGFVVGCRVNQLNAPAFGALVSVPLEADNRVYGLIYDMHIDDDGLVRQLVTAESLDPASLEAVIADNRLNRNVPIEMSVLSVGCSQAGRILHLLPPRPPLSLDKIYLADDHELCQFTAAGHFGYFRHILRSVDLPIGELLAAHLQQASRAQRQVGDPEWSSRATQELITLLRDDYVTLMSVLSALGDIVDL